MGKIRFLDAKKKFGKCTVQLFQRYQIQPSAFGRQLKQITELAEKKGYVTIVTTAQKDKMLLMWGVAPQKWIPESCFKNLRKNLEKNRVSELEALIIAAVDEHGNNIADFREFEKKIMDAVANVDLPDEFVIAKCYWVAITLLGRKKYAKLVSYEDWCKFFG